ncbi:unnamed protein product, partial [Urochloa humidicola]
AASHIHLPDPISPVRSTPTCAPRLHLHRAVGSGKAAVGSRAGSGAALPLPRGRPSGARGATDPASPAAAGRPAHRRPEIASIEAARLHELRASSRTGWPAAAPSRGGEPGLLDPAAAHALLDPGLLRHLCSTRVLSGEGCGCRATRLPPRQVLLLRRARGRRAGRTEPGLPPLRHTCRVLQSGRRKEGRRPRWPPYRRPGLPPSLLPRDGERGEGERS